MWTSLASIVRSNRGVTNLYQISFHEMTNNRQIVRATAGGVSLAAMAKLMQEATPLLRDVQSRLSRRAPSGAPSPSPSKPKKKKKERAASMARMDAPVSSGYSSSTLVKFQQTMASSKSTTYRGCSVLGSVRTSAAATTTLPQCTFFSASNPIVFPDRLQTMASTFDKYVYKSVRLKFQPQVPSSTAGLVALCIDRDYMDPPQVSNWAQVLSYEAAVSGSVWMDHTISLKRETTERRTYFTNFTADLNFRDSEQFKFYVYTLGCPASTILGQLYLDYEIELISPVFAPEEITGATSNFQMQNVVTNTISVPTVSNVFTFAGLPAVGTIASSLIEVITAGNLALPVTVTVGTTGSVWAPPVQNSFRFFLRPVSGGYNIFLDYPSAVSNSATANALYNPGLATFNMITSSSTTYRLLNGTSPNID